MTQSDRDFLHQLRMQLSGRDTIPLSHECLARLVGLAERGTNWQMEVLRNPIRQSYVSSTTDLRLPTDTSTKCTAGFYDEVNP